MTGKKGKTVQIKTVAKGLSKVIKDFDDLSGEMSEIKQTTKGIENQMDSLTSVLKQLGDTSGTKKLVSSMEQLAGTSQDTLSTMEGMSSTMVHLLENIMSLNQATGSMNDNLYEMRLSMDSVDTATSRANEEMEEQTQHMRQSTKERKKYNKEVDKSTKGTEGLARTNGRNGKQMGKMSKHAGILAAQYAIVAANVYALTETFRVLSEAANLERLLTQTATFSASVSGINVKALAADMSRLSGSILSVKESMQFAVKGAAFSFTAEQLERLTVGARKSSIALGINFTDAMDRVMRGISKQEIELFDELGIVTRLTPAFQRYADQVNKTVAELSDYERQLALTNEVQRQLDERFSGIEVYATSWEKLSKNAKDFKDSALMGIADSLSGVAEGLAAVLDISDPVADRTNNVVESLEILSNAKAPGAFITATSELSKALSIVNKETQSIASNVEVYLDLARNIGAVVAVIGALVAVSLRATAANLTLAASLNTVTSSALIAARVGIVAFTAAITRAAVAVAAFIGGTAMMLLALAAIPALIYITTSAQEKSKKASEEAAKVAEDRLHRLADAETRYVAAKKKATELGIDFAAISVEAEKRRFEQIDALRAQYATADAKEQAAILKRVAAVKSQSEMERSLLAERGNALTQSFKTMATGEEKLLSFSNLSNKVTSSFSGALDEVKVFTSGLATNYGGDSIAAGVKESQERFESFTASLKKSGAAPLAPWITGFRELEDAIVNVHEETLSLKPTMTMAAGANTLGGGDAVSGLTTQLGLLHRYQNTLGTIGGISAEQHRKNAERIVIMEQQLQIQKEQKRQSLELATLEYSSAREKESTSHLYTLESTELGRQVSLAKGRYEIQLSNKNLTEVARKEIELIRDRELDLLNIKKRQAEVQEAINLKLLSNRQTLASVQEDIASKEHTKNLVGDNTTAAFDNKNRQQLQQAQIDKANDDISAKGGEVGMGTIAYEEATDKVEALHDSLQRTKELEPRAMMDDWKAGMESLANIPGLDSMTSQVVSATASLGESLFNISESFANGNENLMENLGQAIQAGAEITMSVLSMLSKAKEDSINRQIEAEKRRDGKSEESLAKIKKLEAKKIKEKAKSDKMMVGMGTAVGMIRAFSDLGWPAGIPAAAAMAAMGAFQMSQIDKAASGALAGLGGGMPSKMSITGGTKDNSINVSKAASAGEYAALTSGTPGRAGGGFSEAGSSFIAGERGPEIITPTVPVNVTTAGNSSGMGGGLTFAPVFHAQAVDQAGMEELFQNYSKELYDGLQQELAANNQTLESL